MKMASNHETPVLIVGGGPAGLIAALQLFVNQVPCILVERNPDTTKWPKMDITNVRSMELLKKLGVDQGIRDVGVGQDFSFDVNFSTGLSEGGCLIAKWDLPSPNVWRERIKSHNDGTMPREPYQRCSQAIFEAWLKPHIQSKESITSMFGMKFETLLEHDDHVESHLTDAEGRSHIIKSKYVIGCDGAGSRVRKALGIGLTGGPVPGAMHLVHFKSRDIAKLHQQGQFWHIFFASGHAIISQDEVDTWTLHTPIAVGQDISNIDPYQTIYKGLGGLNGPYKIEIDEILVTSTWRPNICLADKYTSPKARVFLSGDAAHQNIPTGGYGMNTAVGDSFDIGWKVAACVAGHGGEELLRSYEEERRPVALRNIERSGKHWSVHETYWKWCTEIDTSTLGDDSSIPAELRERIARYVDQHDGENKELGIELGYRYSDSRVVVPDRDGTQEPPYSERHYTASTWPGARAPHVFLKDGSTSIHDLFGTGQQYTLIDFTSDGHFNQTFRSVADGLKIPVKLVHLPDEPHARKIWERDAVLIRPDDHVAWRANSEAARISDNTALEVLRIATGHPSSRGDTLLSIKSVRVRESGFTGTVGNVDQEKVTMRATFQQ